MLRTADLNYDLPPELIATRPAVPRDAARLMVIHRLLSDTRVEHATVADLPNLLNPGDLLIFNTTSVLPARFRGTRIGTCGRIEGLYLHEADDAARAQVSANPADTLWIALIKGRHTRAGAALQLFTPQGTPSGIHLDVLGRPQSEPEAWIVRPIAENPLTTHQVLARIGLPPLPPYILRARKVRGIPDNPSDAADYQTVYADERRTGSVAAPTAGLHFTPELLHRLAERGIRRADVTLHVGAGTFRPVETEYIEQHPMHAEWCTLPRQTLRAIQQTRAAGGRIIPVGTTAARTLEAYAALTSPNQPDAIPDLPPSLSTRLLITPGYRFRWCDGLLTNFHLPRSTLMALVAAMLQSRPFTPREAPAEDASPTRDGVALLKTLYTRAVEHHYRFYSFGDAMLIV